MKKQIFNQTAAFLSLTSGAFVAAAPAFAETELNLTNPSIIGNIQQDPSTIIRFVITMLIVIGIVASLLFLLWGGIRWILSGGDKGKVDAARGTIVAAIVGLIIVILAWVIISTVLQILTGCGLSNFRLPTLTPGGDTVNRC